MFEKCRPFNSTTPVRCSRPSQWRAKTLARHRGSRAHWSSRIRLARSDEPLGAIAYFAYLLPRREAVWWGIQCVRALKGTAAPDVALQAADRWVRIPEEDTRVAALSVAGSASRRASTTWLALAAAWSGGEIAPNARAKPHLTAKAVRAAIVLALAEANADPTPWVSAFIDAGLRFVQGGDAKPRRAAE